MNNTIGSLISSILRDPIKVYTLLHSTHKDPIRTNPNKTRPQHKKKYQNNERDTYNPNTTHTTHPTQKQ